MQVATSAAGLGGLLVVGGACSPWGRPGLSAAFPAAARAGRLGSVAGDVWGAGLSLLAVCRHCALPLVSGPSAACGRLRAQRARRVAAGLGAEAEAVDPGAGVEAEAGEAGRQCAECRLYNLEW